MKNQVSLLIDWHRFEGWKDVRITRSIEDAASTFQLSVTDRLPGRVRPILIRPGDKCVVRIGSDVVVTGFIDDVNRSYDARQHSLSISGRSLTGGLVDCSAPEMSGQFVNCRIERIAEHLAEGYRAPIRAEVDTGDPIPDFQVQLGETVFSAIERLARPKGLLITDDADGALVLSRAASRRIRGRIKLGENVLTGSAVYSQRDRHSEYVVKGQRAGDDHTDDAEEFSGPEGVAHDMAVRRFRRLVIIGENPGGAPDQRRRAQWQATRSMGRSLQATYKLQGWRDPAGALWQTNALIKVEDEWLGIERDMLIQAVTFLFSNTGTTVELKLVPPEAYQLLPEVPEAITRGFLIETDPSR